jgi:hypothetical protein
MAASRPETSDRKVTTMPTQCRRARARTLAAVILAGLYLGPASAWADGPFNTFTVAPCRVVDTREVGGPIPAGGTRNFLVAGTIPNQGGETDCGIPFPEAKGVFINIVAVSPSGFGYLIAYPYPSSLPLASTLNFSPGQTIANGVLVPICDDNVDNCIADLTVTMGPAAADMVIDVTGYLQATGQSAQAQTGRPRGR